LPLLVNQEFKNLAIGLEIPEGDLCVFVGPNNSGKSAVLQYLNIYSDIRDQCDYISPRRFDLSNEVSIALNSDQELTNLFNERKQYNPAVAELNAPDAIRELIGLSNAARSQIIDWHNRYFGKLSVERSDPDNEYAPPRITIDGRLATQQGSGSRSVLAVLVSLIHPNRPIILIDEPEIGIEPQVQKKLARLIKDVVAGTDGLPKKRVVIATHSHLFLDRENIDNNYIVSKDIAGHAQIHQVGSQEELHSLIFHLLGNSPEDLFFPDNMLIVEGPSDQIYWRRLLELHKAGGIAVHFTDGDSKVGSAVGAIDQMLKTQAYLPPWYRERLCIIVDESVPDKTIEEWRAFLGDDGKRVRKLTKNGIEFYYPGSYFGVGR